MRAATFIEAGDQTGVGATVETAHQAARSAEDAQSIRRWLEDDAVYGRTTAGQREVIFNQRPLAPISRRLLLLVNGETPLRNLLDLLEGHDQRLAERVLQLVDEKLIELCDPRTPGVR
jgi:hypothetical protein